MGEGGVREDVCTSAAASLSAVHSMRGRRFVRKRGLKVMSTCSSSASRKCRGNELGDVLQVFTAQVRKLAVRSFMFGEVEVDVEWNRGKDYW